MQVGSASEVALADGDARVRVLGLGRDYGGIGGAFSTLTVDIEVPGGVVAAATLPVTFRFIRSDGVASGFRVLSLSLLDAQGRDHAAPGAFAQEDPAAWTAPRPGEVAAGEALWRTAALRARPGGGAIRATCSDCHAQDGRDLKYFNYSNHAIVVRSQFHGLSVSQGQQIASYIRTLSASAAPMARPWNPPYQPGPAVGNWPTWQWSAGAGLSAVLEKDLDMLPYVPHASDPAGLVDADRRPLRVNVQEIPVALQFPDWNRWLPHIHPKDSLGDAFFVYDAEVAPGGAGGHYLRARAGLKPAPPKPAATAAGAVARPGSTVATATAARRRSRTGCRGSSPHD